MIVSNYFVSYLYGIYICDYTTFQLHVQYPNTQSPKSPSQRAPTPFTCRLLNTALHHLHACQRASMHLYRVRYLKNTHTVSVCTLVIRTPTFRVAQPRHNHSAEPPRRQHVSLRSSLFAPRHHGCGGPCFPPGLEPFDGTLWCLQGCQGSQGALRR